MSELQSVYFMSSQWTTKQARDWLKSHNIQPLKRVEKTTSELRYRIKDPKQFQNFATKIILHNKGAKHPLEDKKKIYFVIGIK